MKYAQIREMDVTNGSGIGVALFTQGCPYHCKNCFNPETWDFDKGTDWTKETENNIIELLKPEYITRLSILGGEPLIERNIAPLTALLKRVKGIYPDKQVWLYSGGKASMELYKNLPLRGVFCKTSCPVQSFVTLQRPFPVIRSFLPRRSFRSSKSTFCPRLAAVMAANIPAGPKPTTTGRLSTSTLHLGGL